MAEASVSSFRPPSLYVATPEVGTVVERFGVADVEGAFWSHRNETCNSNTILDRSGCVHGADTARMDLAPADRRTARVSLGLPASAVTTSNIATLG